MIGSRNHRAFEELFGAIEVVINPEFQDMSIFDDPDELAKVGRAYEIEREQRKQAEAAAKLGQTAVLIDQPSTVEPQQAA